MPNFLLALARTWRGLLFHFIFSRYSFVIPRERFIETDALHAFYHLSPSYALHILTVPNARIKALADQNEANRTFMPGLFEAVKRLVERFDVQPVDYRLSANGGKYQQVDCPHFHLFSEGYSEG
ncbi:MAG: HIT domain-containing protein [Candidatus Promineifilaceae bacterium]